MIHSVIDLKEIIFYRVQAINKPEFVYNFVKDFDSKEEAIKYCSGSNFKYDLYTSFGKVECDLYIVEVKEKVINPR